MIKQNGKLYLSVKEYAEAAEISHQAAYKQLQTRLKGCTIEVEGQTYIEAAMIEKYYGLEPATQVVQVAQAEVEQQSQADKRHIEQLEKMIDILQDELKQKNKQIDDLNERLREAIENVSQEQKLHLVTQNKLTLIEQKEEAAAEEEKKQQEQEQEQEKKHWWQRRR